MNKKEEDLLYKGNWLVISFGGYDNELIVPYKDGVTILGALEHACKYKQHRYSDPYKISPISQEDNIKSNIISHKEYLEGRAQYILGLTDDNKTDD